MIKSILNTKPYTWGGSCEGWHLINSNSISVIQEKMPGGTSEIQHYHQKSQQVFFILSGTAIFEINDKTLTMVPLEAIHVPAGIRHRIKNNTEQDLIFLVISVPKAHGDKITIFD